MILSQLRITTLVIDFSERVKFLLLTNSNVQKKLNIFRKINYQRNPSFGVFVCILNLDVMIIKKKKGKENICNTYYLNIIFKAFSKLFLMTCV